MKKFLSVILIFLIIITLSACRKVNPPDLTLSYTDDSSYYSNSSELPVINNSSEIQNPDSSDEGGTSSTESQSQSDPQACEHDYIVTTVDKTCNVDGFTEYVCKKCGHSFKEVLEKSGHNYVNYVCSVCNQPDRSNPNKVLASGVQSGGTADEHGIKRYYLPSDKCYSVRAYDNGWFIFQYISADSTEKIYLFVYDYDVCKLQYTYKGSDLKIEFDKKNFHSTSLFWTSATVSGTMDYDDMVSQIRGKIDDFMKKFEEEFLIPELSLTLNNFGFISYRDDGDNTF